MAADDDDTADVKDDDATGTGTETDMGWGCGCVRAFGCCWVKVLRCCCNVPGAATTGPVDPAGPDPREVSGCWLMVFRTEYDVGTECDGINTCFPSDD